MHKFLSTLLIGFGLVSLPHMAGAAEHQGYSVVDNIAGPDGGYDYISVDPKMQRVFVGRSYGVMAIDLATRKVIPALIKENDVAAVLIIPNTNLMLSTNNGDNTATLFNRSSGKFKAKIQTGEGPDGALYEPMTNTAFVMNGDSEDATVIDLKSATVKATIPLGGKPEAAASDEQGHVYINIEDTAEIAVVDVKNFKVVNRYTLPGCVEPTGISYDAKTGLLISACHNGTAKLIDAKSGADRGSVKIGQNADGSIFDTKRRLAYIPCFDGTLTIFHLNKSGNATILDTVTTRKGARTAALDPENGRLYLPSRQYKYDKDGTRSSVPGTFTVTIVASDQ